MAVDTGLAVQAVIAFFWLQGAVIALSELLNEVGPCVVTGSIVLATGVSQSDDQLNCGSHNRVVTVQLSQNRGRRCA